jgi:hypothetical protein
MNEISKLMIRTWINDLLDKGYSASFINRILVLMGNLYTIENYLDVVGWKALKSTSSVGLSLM